MSDTTFAIGAHVYLRGCRVGPPGRIIRLERGKVVIHWPDLDMIGRHSPASLVVVQHDASRNSDCDQNGVEDTSAFATRAAALRAKLECEDENVRLEAAIALTDQMYGRVD